MKLKSLFVTIRFFRAHWPEVMQAAELTAEELKDSAGVITAIWREVTDLAGKLAEELRQAQHAE